MEAAKQQQAFFQQHLQELTLFKAKTSAALLQVRAQHSPSLSRICHALVSLVCPDDAGNWHLL